MVPCINKPHTQKISRTDRLFTRDRGHRAMCHAGSEPVDCCCRYSPGATSERPGHGTISRWTLIHSSVSTSRVTQPKPAPAWARATSDDRLIAAVASHHPPVPARQTSPSCIGTEAPPRPCCATPIMEHSPYEPVGASRDIMARPAPIAAVTS